jgi:hypothetical protein
VALAGKAGLKLETTLDEVLQKSPSATPTWTVLRQIRHYIDHDKRQLSTSLSGVTINFLSSGSLKTCNDIIFKHQGASLKDKREFLVEKYAFSCRRHFPRVGFREIVSLSSFGYYALPQMVLCVHYPCLYIE